MTVVLSCLVMQMQTCLEAVRSEFHNLARTAASLKKELKTSDFKGNRLQGQLDKANSKVEQLSEVIYEVAKAKQQVAGLSTQLDEANNRHHALETELQLARSEAKQLRSELNSARSKVFEMESSLKGNEGKLKDERGKPVSATIGKEARSSGSATKELRKNSLDAISPLAERRHAVLKRGSSGRDYLIRTLVFEASGETEIGKAAVAHVILNRMRSGRWGRKIEDVVTYPWQFEPWMTRKSEIEKLSHTDPRYLDAAEIADAVLAGQIADPTAGATHFLNPVVVRKRRGGSLPSWADGDGQPIGRHVFYCPECDGAEPSRAKA